MVRSVTLSARILKTLAGFAVGAIFVVVFLRQIDMVELGSLLARAVPGWLLLGLAAFTADFILRAVRFWIMIRLVTGRSLPFGAAAGPFVASFGINDILPLRAGDGFRLVWFNRRFAIPAGTVLGAMLVERILDLASILLLGAVALSLADVAPPAVTSVFQIVAVGTLAVCIAVLAAPAILAGLVERLAPPPAARVAGRIAGALRATSGAFRAFRAPRRLAGLLLISVACWLLESLAFFGAWWSLGGAFEAVATPFLAYVFGVLGTLVPGLPGHFGTFHVFAAETLAAGGVDRSLAAGVVLLAHLILWLPTGLFAVVWLLANPADRARLARGS